MSGQAKHFAENEGMIITHNNDTTFFGVGGLEPEQDYMPLSQTSDQQLVKEYKKKLTTAHILRNDCFIWDPIANKVFYFENIGSFTEDKDYLRKIKIKKALEKIQAFNILPGQIVLISLDTPVFNKGIQSNSERFHIDAFVKVLLHRDIRVILLNNIKDKIFENNYSDYTCIEYRNDCVSTTLKNPLTNGDFYSILGMPWNNIMCQ